MPYTDANVRQELLEAVLSLLDGAPRAYVARRYQFSEAYLTMVKLGQKRPDIREEAREIYGSYRRSQRGH